MKKCLIMALAAFGLAACADNFDETNTPVHNGELEESYIAINLMSADRDTRILGDENSYELGTDAERAVKTAYFFFFDEDGNPFNVTSNNGATAPGGDKNYLELTIDDETTSAMPNVSDIKNAVLILNTYKGVYPSKIVAVLNWTPSASTYTLDNLHESLATIYDQTTQGYVMSNSVYMDGAGQEVDAVPLTAANIKTSAGDAMANPVNIYVERTAAKVVLTASGKVENTTNIFDTEKETTPVVTLGSPSTIDVYVQLHGWELYNDYNKSSLLKNINTSWTVANLGFNWNDLSFYRCYWASTQKEIGYEDEFSWSYSTPADKGFPTEYGFNVASSANYTDGTYTYCGENTTSVANDRTKVILKGQLVKKNGENYEPLELARWYGTEYAGEEDLKTAVANSLKYTLFYKDNENDKYVSIAPGDLQCVVGSSIGAEAYEVGFQLKIEAKGKDWYKYSSEDGYEVLGSLDGDANAIATNQELAKVEPALLYNDGQTYYIVDIEHLGADEKIAEYGVVRNHVYQIDIQSIKGYGSPVYNGLTNIEDPKYPEVQDESSYVAAKINVLSWKIVKQGVNIQQ